MKGKFLDFAGSGLTPTVLVTRTASSTQTQGQGAISSTAIALIVQYSTVANALDTCTLPTAAVGRQVLVRNDGAATLQVFPASGANFVGLAANAPTTIPAGDSWLFVGLSATVWGIW